MAYVNGDDVDQVLEGFEASAVSAAPSIVDRSQQLSLVRWVPQVTVDLIARFSAGAGSGQSLRVPVSAAPGALGLPVMAIGREMVIASEGVMGFLRDGAGLRLPRGLPVQV